MIKLRLQRHGRKRRPYYHIVAADARSPRDGRIVERLGRYDNVSEKKETILNEDRVIYWLNTGAQPTTAVRNILKNSGLLYKMHLLRWGKTEEEIAAALAEWNEAKEARSKTRLVSRKEKMKDVLATEEKEYKNQIDKKSKEAAAKLKAEKEAAEAPVVEEVSADAPAAEEVVTEEAVVAEASEESASSVEEAPAAEVAEASTDEAPVEEAPVATEEAPAEEVAAAEEPAAEDVKASSEAEEASDAASEDEK